MPSQAPVSIGLEFRVQGLGLGLGLTISDVLVEFPDLRVRLFWFLLSTSLFCSIWYNWVVC